MCFFPKIGIVPKHLAAGRNVTSGINKFTYEFIRNGLRPTAFAKPLISGT